MACSISSEKLEQLGLSENKTQTGLSASAIFLMVVSLGLTKPPERYLESLVFFVCILLLQTRGVELLPSFRFSPAVPLALALSFLPGVGLWPVVMALLADALLRTKTPFWRNIAHNFSLSLSLSITALLLWKSVEPVQVLVLSVACFCVTRLFLLSLPQKDTDKSQRAVWRQLQIQIRPLEIALALLTGVVYIVMQSQWWAVLFFLPLLAYLHFAAHNALLRSQEAVVSRSLKKIDRLEKSSQKTKKALEKTQEQRVILENLADFLSGEPKIREAAQAVVQTSVQVLPCDNVAIFLGSPPEPFAYELTDAHQARVEGLLLTQLREEIVDRSLSRKRLLSARIETKQERIFVEDQFAVASPLGQLGVLYAGGGDSRLLTKESLQRVKWLSEKAELALKTARKGYLIKQRLAAKDQAVERLATEVESLSTLVNSAQKLASSLELGSIQTHFLELLENEIDNHGGCLYLDERLVKAWGTEPQLPTDFLRELAQRGQAYLSSKPSQAARLVGDNSVASLIASPLLTSNRSLGAACLLSRESQGLGKEQRDRLFLLCSQAAMAFSNAQLYSEVVQSRKDLEASQAALIQSNKMAAISQLSGGVAHQLNSPLGAISLCLEGASDMFETSPKTAQKMLTKGLEAVERSQAIIDRMLNFSARSEGQYKEVVFSELVRDTLDFCSHHFKTAEVKWDFKVETEVKIQVEYHTLQQALTNILVNAVQALENKEGERSVKLRLGLESNLAKLDIQDNGPGIPQDMREKIFDPFVTSKAVDQGTGLGLWVTRQILEAHGGQVSVLESDLGAHFRVILPKL